MTQQDKIIYEVDSLNWLLDPWRKEIFPYGKVLTGKQVNELSVAQILTSNRKPIEVAEEEDGIPMYYICARSHYGSGNIALYPIKTKLVYNNITLNERKIDQTIDTIEHQVRRALDRSYDNGREDGRLLTIQDIRGKLTEITDMLPEGWIRGVVAGFLDSLLREIRFIVLEKREELIKREEERND